MPTCGVGLLRDDLERRIVRLAIPALGTLAVEPLYVLVDTAIVGRLGTPQLAGLAIASTVLLTVVSLTAALEYGLTPDVAFAHGRGDEPEARRVATNGLQLAALLGVPMGLALGLAARPLCWLLGGRGDVLEGRREGDPADERRLVLGGELAAGHRAGRRGGDEVASPGQGRRVHLDGDDRVPVAREHLGDTGPHGAEADDGDGAAKTTERPHGCSFVGAAAAAAAAVALGTLTSQRARAR